MKTIFKNLSCLCLGFALLAGGPASAKTSIPVVRGNFNDLQFGRGWDSRKELARGYCVEMQAANGGKPDYYEDGGDGAFDLRLQRDQKSVAQKLGVSGSGRYRTGAVTASASADLVKEMSSNEFGISYTFVGENVFSQKMDPHAGYPVAVTDGFKSSVSKRDLFFSGCGDEYVQTRNYAARLAVNINVTFVSRSERDRFAAEFGVNSPVMDFKAKVDTETKKYSSANRMSIRAVQIGGDPAKVTTMLCAPSLEGKPDPDCDANAREVVDCAFGDLKRCTTVIANAVAYAGKEGGFSKQVIGKTNYQVTSLETVPFVSLGAPFLAPPSDQRLAGFAASADRVAQVFDEQFALQALTMQLYSGSAPRLTPRQKDAMEELRTKHFDNVEAAVQALDECYDSSNLEKCNREYEKLIAKIKANEKIPLTDSIVKGQRAIILSLTNPEQFVQFCDVADGNHPQIRTTIETLRAYATSKLPASADRKTSPYLDGDHCFTLGQWFEQQTELDLSSFDGPIEDLGPITSLQNLRTLNLTRKNIATATPFANMTGLQDLTLDDNRISDLSPLVSLVNLKKLSVQHNQLTGIALTPLAVLGTKGHLVKIDARDNDESMACPLASPTNCKLLSFANSANVSTSWTKCEETIRHEAVMLSSNFALATGGRGFPGGASAKMQVVSNDGCRILANTMAVPRLGHTMTNVDQGILVVGGGTSKIELIDRLSLQSKVLPGALQENVTNHTATALPDGRVLIVGGATDADPTRALMQPSGLSSLVQIVAGDGTVEVLGRLAVPRAEHTATLLKSGKVLILGGYSLNKMVDMAEIIDPVAKTITQLTEKLPTGRMAHTAARLANGHVLIIGGARWFDQIAGNQTQRIASPVSEIVDFDPEAKHFRVLDETLTPARSNMQSATLSDGRILLIGGLRESKATDTEIERVQTAATDVQVYDPRSESVYQVGQMLNARLGFTATMVGSDRVLIFGGRPVISVTSTAGGLTRQGMVTSTELIVYQAH